MEVGNTCSVEITWKMGWQLEIPLIENSVEILVLYQHLNWKAKLAEQVCP